MHHAARLLAPTIVLAAATTSHAAPVYGLSMAGNRIVGFDTSNPAALTSDMPVSGLAPGESLITIDARPATGELYTLSNQNRMYVVSPLDGAARQILAVGAVPFTISGSAGMDFNPAVDRIRVTTSTGQNLRLHPVTGGLVSDDSAANGPVRYDASDANAALTPRAISVAYTNGAIGGPAPAATGTTMYVMDAQSASSHFLATQGSINSSPISPNLGRLFNSAAVAGAFPGDEIGLDILASGGVNTAFLSAQTLGGSTGFYGLDITNGSLSFLGAIAGGSLQVRDIAVVPAPGLATAFGTLALISRRRR